MGPDGFQTARLPSRPKYSWDTKTCPWTDGVGNQEGFAHSVKQWSHFHDTLADNNSNKIPSAVRGIVLEANLYGRAKNICRCLTQEELTADDGVQKIVDLLYKRCSLSVLSEIYKDFHVLVNLRRKQHESYRDFESRFAAMLAKYNSHANVTKLSEPVSAMMLMNNSGIDDTQRISIISAASPNAVEGNNPTNDQFVGQVKYEDFASVLRQCDCTVRSSQTINSHSGSAVDTQKSNKYRRRQLRRNWKQPKGQNSSHNQLTDLKSRTQCRKCLKFGHWQRDHNDDGSLKPGVASYDKPRDSNQSSIRGGKMGNNNNDAPIQFGMANVVQSDVMSDEMCGSDESSDPISSRNSATDVNQNEEFKTPFEDSSPTVQSNQISQTEINLDERNVEHLIQCEKHADLLDDLVMQDISAEMACVPSYNSALEIDCDMAFTDLHDQMTTNEFILDLTTSSDGLTRHMFNDPTIKTLNVGMADYEYTSSVNRSTNLGPMVDDGAPYSALGIVELSIIKPRFADLDPIPKALKKFKYWQFGSGAHCSPAKPILGSTNLKFKSDNSNPIVIRHIIVEGSSPWILGRNVTRHCDIVHIGGHYIRLPNRSGMMDTITMVDHHHHSYIPLTAVAVNDSSSTRISMLAGFSASTKSDSSTTDMPWPELKKVLDRVHTHVCGHASYSDIKTLLERNNLWNDASRHYISSTMQNCVHCMKSASPKPTRKVSLHMLNKEFNDTVFIDHFYLEDMRIFHIMDGASRFSAISITPNTTMKEAIVAFHSSWLNVHWSPSYVQADQAFNNDEFSKFVDNIGAQLKLVPPRRHNKNILEPKHRIIRNIFSRLRDSNPEADARMLAFSAVRISNDMYGSDTLSAFEMCRGITKPIAKFISPVAIPQNLIESHQKIIAKRKLNMILRSKAIDTKMPVKIGDSVQVFVRNAANNRGKWLSPRPIVEIDRRSETVTVPGSHGHKIIASFEDIRTVPCDDEFARLVSESLDELDDEVRCALEQEKSVGNRKTTNVKNKRVKPCKHRRRKSVESTDDRHRCASDDEQVFDDSNVIENDTSSNDYTASDHVSGDNNDGSNEQDSQMPDLGDQVDIYWSEDDEYYSGVVTEVDETGHTIVYDDGDVEIIDFSGEQWRFTGSQDGVLESNTVSGLTTLSRNEQEALGAMFKYFGNKPFMRHEAQGFSQAAIMSAYQREEDVFLENVKIVRRTTIPTDANIISSHTLYKLKVNDDSSLKLKARIAPHGNEDSLKTVLRNDCCMCAPMGIRIVLMLASLCGWKVAKADVKSAFLQTGRAARDVYVVPPRESKQKNVLWLLLSAAYGLVNSNAKWQVLSDRVFKDFGLKQSTDIPQLFYSKRNNGLQLVIAKIVDDFLITGEQGVVDKFLSFFDKRYKFGSVSRGPGRLRFYGLDIIQDETLASTIDGDDKLMALEPVPVTRSRRRELTEEMNELEKSSFMSVNASINWLGITASPLCAFYASHLQQKLPDGHVSNLTLQSSVLKKLKKYGTVCAFPRPPRGVKTQISAIMFADAGRNQDVAQISIIGGILLGPLKKDSPFYALTWASHKSKRPVRSIGSAEIIAVSEAIDEGKVIKNASSQLLGIDVPLIVATDSKDLYSSLSTQRNSIDKSIRADVNVIRFEFETMAVNTMVWIPGKCNPADPGTKRDSPLAEVLQLMLFTGKIPLSFEEIESTSSNRSLG